MSDVKIMAKKLIIEMYDPKITKPPLKMIILKEVDEVNFEYVEGDSGVHQAAFLQNLAKSYGYWMRFYTQPDDKTIAIVVTNPESTSVCGRCLCDIDEGKEYCDSCAHWIYVVTKIQEESEKRRRKR